jgi:small-conductance mechanosensitive channel
MKAMVEKARHRFVTGVFKAYQPSSIDFDFIFESRPRTGGAAAAQQQVALGLLRALKEHGIEIAYPAQTTFTAAPDGTLVMPYVCSK